MKRYAIPVTMAALALVLVAAGTVRRSSLAPASSPEGAVHSLFTQAQGRNWNGAYRFVSKTSNTDPEDFYRDIGGSDGSLRTYSNLFGVDTKVLRENESEAMVRANLTYSSAVGTIHATRDLKVVNEEGSWKVVWPTVKQAKVPPQVILVNYLRWDVINRGLDDDWGAQNVDAPRVRIVSMNAIEKEGGTIILGEIANEDTVPGFVTVEAILQGKNGEQLGREESFDKISHTLLPKEISPFRIDFPGVKLANIKSVRMNPSTMLVPASADPVIGVLHQQLSKNSQGGSELQGELLNQSGQTVNIPHVLATFYDSTGKVIWVSDTYVDRALQPQTPLPFRVALRDDLAPLVNSYRVTVNQYSLDRKN
jgi:hypothetical protein